VGNIEEKRTGPRDGRQTGLSSGVGVRICVGKLRNGGNGTGEDGGEDSLVHSKVTEARDRKGTGEAGQPGDMEKPRRKELPGLEGGGGAKKKKDF